MTDVKQLIDDPSYLAYKFDFTNETIEFISLAEGDLESATWLTRDLLGVDSSSTSVPLVDVLRSINSHPEGAGSTPPRFIFHTAYCASTFLSRCLSVKGVSVSLREPQLLLDAANAKRVQWRSKTSKIDFRHLPALALRLLRKHAEPHETLIIKPINSVNNIIAELLHASGAPKALMLYTDARNFLLSTLKKGQAATQRQRGMFDLLRCDFPHLSQLGLSDVIHLSDLKISLTLWRLQLEQAEQALTHSSTNGMLGSLNAEILINQPDMALQAANKFLQLGISSEAISKIALGDLSTRDAKNMDNSFSVSTRQAAYQKIEDFYGSDLVNGYKWLTTNNPLTSLTPSLSGSIEL
ncbi:MAG: hypothetical protein JKX81_17245 [Arenicella sp.]|nr:hypothetical protein [Arenicella sp.]